MPKPENTLGAALLKGYPGLGTTGSSAQTQTIGEGKKQTATQCHFQPVDQRSGRQEVKQSMNQKGTKTNKTAL